MKLNLPCKLSCLNSNLVLNLGYLNPALNNSALGFGIWNSDSGILNSAYDWNPSFTDNESLIARNPESKTFVDQYLTWGECY